MGPVFSLFRVLYCETKASPPIGSSVLITGCDTGFGRGTAIQLSRLGYRVFAGCLTEEGLKSIAEEAATQLLTPFKLDVTKEADVKAAAELIERESPQGLHGLINNAGINSGSVIEWSSLNDFRKTMEVNYFGTVSMTLALLPHLRRTKGQSRIINVTSVCAWMAPPGMASYSASKHATSAFSDVLRREMRQFGITVTSVEPGFMKTPIVTSAASVVQNVWNSLSAEKQAYYGSDFYKEYSTQTVASTQLVASDPKIVVDEICDAFLTTHPKHRVRIGNDIYLYQFLRPLPTWISDTLISLASWPKTKPLTAIQ